MMVGLDEDEEEEANHDLLPLYLVYLQPLMEKYLPSANAHLVEMQSEDPSFADGLFIMMIF